MRLVFLLSLLLAACADGGRQPASDRTADAEAPAAPAAPPRARPSPVAGAYSGFVPPRVPEDPVLSRMLAAIAPFQAHQQPCIARKELGPDHSIEQRRRSKVIWSDSIELQNRIRAAHGSRILVMTPDVSAGADRARFLVKVTGQDPLPAYRLGGRARDVPVVVEYGMPYSADQPRQKVSAAYADLMRLLPDAQGWGVSEGYGLGALFIHVYSPTGQPPPNLTPLCEQLREAVGMPVLLSYTTGRMSLQ